MSTLGNEIMDNIYLIIAIIVLIILLIIFFVHLYFNIRAPYYPNKKEFSEKETLYFKRLKYIILLVLFFITLTILYIVNPNNIFTNYYGGIILISIFIGTIIISMLSFYNFTYRHLDKQTSEEKHISPMNYFLKSLIYLLFGGVAALAIYFLVDLVSPMPTSNSTVNFSVNLVFSIFIILIILALVCKIFNIPNCSILGTLKFLFSTLKSFLINIFHFFQKGFSSSTISSILILIITMIFLYLYFKLPSIKEKINLQGGKQLINRPISTSNLSVVASHNDLNGSDDLEYQYAISFWVYVNSYPPNTNFSYDTYVSLLNYGNKPNVLFNVGKNSLMITMPPNKDGTNKSFDVDANGNIIIYIKNKFLLQKWNNIIINYSGGTLDIFINGELVKSAIGIIPFMSLDNLSVGADQGIGGGICNLVYFTHALNANNIYYIYNMVKDKAPPILDNSLVTEINNIN